MKPEKKQDEGASQSAMEVDASEEVPSQEVDVTMPDHGVAVETMPVTDDMIQPSVDDDSRDGFLHEVAPEDIMEGEEIPGQMFLTAREQEEHAKAIQIREQQKKKAQKKANEKFGKMLHSIVRSMDVLESTAVSFQNLYLLFLLSQYSRELIIFINESCTNALLL